MADNAHTEFETAVAAAREALQLDDNAAALAEAERAIGLADEWPEAERAAALADCHELRGRAYQYQHRYSLALREFEGMQEYARTPERALDARIRIGSVLIRLGEYDRAVGLLQNAYLEAAKRGYERGFAEANLELGIVAHMRGDSDQALRYLERAWPVYRALNDLEARQSTLVFLGHAHARRGEYDEAIRYHEEALRLALASEQRMWAAIQLNNLGESFQRLGDMAAALEYHQRSLTMREQHGLLVSADLIRNLGVDLLGLGRHDEALDHLRRALSMARREGNKDYLMQARASLCEALATWERLEEAAEMAQELLEEAVRLHSEYFRARALMVLGRVLLARGEPAEAYATLEEGHCAAQAMHGRELLWQLHDWLSEAAAAPALADVHVRISAELLLESAALIKNEELRHRFLANPRASLVLSRAQAKGIRPAARRLGRG